MCDFMKDLLLELPYLLTPQKKGIMIHAVRLEWLIGLPL